VAKACLLLLLDVLLLLKQLHAWRDCRRCQPNVPLLISQVTKKIGLEVLRGECLQQERCQPKIM